jgi:ankyrin repeat protein
LSPTNVDYLLAAGVYVAYRNNNPDAATVTAAQNDMEKNNIDASQMLAWTCPYDG